MVPAIWKRAALLWVLVLAACTIQLVPSYDQALVEGLDQAHTEALTLFAAVENGSDASKFGEYEQRYAAVIGRFEALVQRAESRQIPPLAARLSRLGLIQRLCTSANDATACVNTSPASMRRVLAVIRRMRDAHQSPRGLPKDIVEGLKGDYVTAVEQAITVENALKR